MSAKAILSASVSAPPAVYVEDVFSTFLYTGNGSTQTITNGIDLAGEGGLVWLKDRSNVADPFLFDTARGAGNHINSNNTGAQEAALIVNTDLYQYNSDGFTLGANYWGGVNTPNHTFASWTFRKAAKFFDVVTYTGTGANRTIAHNLGAVPGSIIVKRTDTTAAWAVYHRSLANTQYLVLNTTATAATGATWWNSTTPTSSVFSVGTNASVNASGGTYVAYVFAHDAGGFGTAGTDNVVSCGSFTATSAGSVNLGWEPQWFLVKSTTYASSWYIVDNMRGFPAGPSSVDKAFVLADSSNAENLTSGFAPTATGFNYSALGDTWIYIAIRRGPMKTPTVGTEVFSAVTYTGTGTNSRVYTGAGFPTDAIIINDRLRTSGYSVFVDRIRGGGANLVTLSAAAEATGGTYYSSRLDSMDGYTGGTSDNNQLNLTSLTLVDYYFRRAPGFFDVVAYTGDSATGRSITHNLTVAPKIIIVKMRTGGTSQWVVYHAEANGGTGPSSLYLDATNAANAGDLPYFWGTSTIAIAPTSSVFTVNAFGGYTNGSGFTYIAYLFATAPGVSKVFNFTGTGTTLQIDCGFTSGARLVLIKRTDSTGDWYIWDSARGIISGNDPYLLLNSTAAEVTNTDYIDPYSAGFEISSTAPAAINANGGSYIGLAIA